jgi:regulatory protein
MGQGKDHHELKQKRVSDYCIKKGLKEIDENDYIKTLDKLAAAKWDTLKGETNLFVKLRKTQDYLLQKGYESGLIREALQKVRDIAQE